MPENNDFSTFNLGIHDTEVVGSFDAAEAFLSGSPEGIQKLDEKKEEKKEETIKKKEEKKEEEINAVDDIFGKEESEEEGGEKEEEGKKDEETNDEGETQVSYEALSKDLLRLGIFTQLEDEKEVKSADDLLERFQLEKQMGATDWLENFLSKFGDDRREMFQAIYIDGVDPKEYLPTFNNIQEFENMDISSETSQKAIFREYYTRLNWTAEEIEKKLTKTIDYGDLADETKVLHSKIIEDNKKKLSDIADQAKVQNENAKRLDLEYKSSIQKTLTDAIQKREFKGIPVTEKRANEVAEFLYTPKYKTADGKILTEFDKFILESKKADNIEQRVIIAMLKLDNFDFSKINKVALSKSSDKLFSEFATKHVKTETRDITKMPQKNKVWDNL